MPLPKDWSAFIASLNSSGVEYLIVGAVALAHHGFPRYTGDLDILVRNSPERVARTCVLQVRGSFQAEPQTSMAEVCATLLPHAEQWRAGSLRSHSAE